MTEHVANRRSVVEALRRELVGPAPAGPELNLTAEVRLTNLQETYGPWREAGTGQEILVRDSPTKRYGVGVLYPVGKRIEEVAEHELDEDEAPFEQPGEPLDIEDERPVAGAQEAETDDFDLSLANAYQPSSMGVSFLANVSDNTALVVDATGGRYRRVPVTIAIASEPERTRMWWVRRAVRLKVTFPSAYLRKNGTTRLVAGTGGASSQEFLVESECVEDLDLRVEVVSRPHGPDERLLTVCFINRSTGSASLGELCLFQSGFIAEVVRPEGEPAILPYPGPQFGDDEEEESFALLYRRSQVFATGHGCSADWNAQEESECALSVRAECLPAVETPTITPDIRRADGSPLTSSMASLAGLTLGDDGLDTLEEVIVTYERWISERRSEIDTLPLSYRAAGTRHLKRCEEAASRMRCGLYYLREDGLALLAFRLANHAILLQQLVTRDAPRATTYDPVRRVLTFSEELQIPDISRLTPKRGQWRAFQVAFLLASLRSAVDGASSDRRTVELIWFPTGGGKTEAYLGLAAFAAFKRRLDNPMDCGVHVLMRYTLRLLTAQQFQRASGLLCAMEYLRRRNAGKLGETPFSAGIWLGGDTTPNSREVALRALRELQRYKGARNPFVLARCPWCGAQFGRIDVAGKASKKGSDAFTPGYVRYQEPGQNEATVAFVCPDTSCEFASASGLPIYVIDDDIYERKPTLVIGTIDKFAMLAWQPRARSLFGLADNGERVSSPPGLVIQDELHLIAGPIGSVAGLYETVIEELCTDRRFGNAIPPKIVCSTATIRRSHDQIRGLYARDEVALFPPPGLDAGDSFFARYDKTVAGRVFVGVHAVSLGSVQTEWVRTFTALLQAPMPLDADGRDPWWTLLVFFNSIREMGTAHTLFQSDVPDYTKVLCNREGTPREQRRYLSASRVFELTGGLPSDEITGAIATLEVGCTSRGIPKDVCLASSVIEVGIDISRLSLMVVAGQPKTTSQYIQVTGRVGRQKERPGLVVTMYSPSKPRDRSHFERFRSYHERLYAHVEPTSVTPFSPPALDRALHAVLVAYSRQCGDAGVARSPFPYPKDLVDRFRILIEERVLRTDPVEAETLRRKLRWRAGQWLEWQRTRWTGDPQGDEAPLLRVSGEYASPAVAKFSWSTPTSMRNVDAECEAQITTHYIYEEDTHA